MTTCGQCKYFEARGFKDKHKIKNYLSIRQLQGMCSRGLLTAEIIFGYMPIARYVLTRISYDNPACEYYISADLTHQHECPGCEDELEQRNGHQKALVAFGCLGNATLLAATRGLRDDFSEAGIDAGDVWTPHKNGAPDEGMLGIWEGRIVYSTTPNTPNGPAESDVDYVGKWRSLSSSEMQIVLEGGGLWPEETRQHTCSIGLLEKQNDNTK